MYFYIKYIIHLFEFVFILMLLYYTGTCSGTLVLADIIIRFLYISHKFIQKAIQIFYFFHLVLFVSYKTMKMYEQCQNQNDFCHTTTSTSTTGRCSTVKH